MSWIKGNAVTHWKVAKIQVAGPMDIDAVVQTTTEIYGVIMVHRKLEWNGAWVKNTTIQNKIVAIVEKVQRCLSFRRQLTWMSLGEGGHRQLFMLAVVKTVQDGAMVLAEVVIRTHGSGAQMEWLELE